MAIIIKQSFILPLPPSANQLWVRTKTGMRKSDKAVAYYELAGFEAIRQGAVIWDCEIAITIRVYRKRKIGDLDNFIKPLLDALQGVAFYNDNQIIEIHAYRYDDKKKPRVEVIISEVD